MFPQTGLYRSPKFALFLFQPKFYYVRFEVFTAVTIKKAVPPKRRLIQFLHGATSQKFEYVTVITTSTSHFLVQKNLIHIANTAFLGESF
jgi:hypothetical protein